MAAIAAFAGLSAGLVQAGVAAVRRLVLHTITFNGPDLAWMAPLGTLAVFLVFAIPVAALVAISPRIVPLRAVLGYFIFLAMVSVLFLFKQLSPAASILLAVGTAWQLSGRLGRQPDRVARRARRGVLALGGVVALVASLVLVVLPLSRARGLARISPAPEGSPNLLLLILDTVRRDELGVYGYPLPTTPRIDALAARGAVFEQAFVSAPWTLASHASMFTGRRPGELSARWWTPLDHRFRTVAEVLRDHGYRTAGFAANYAYTGFESGLSRGFMHYEDLIRSPRQVVWSATLAQMRMLRELWHARSAGAVWRALRRHEIRVAGRALSRDHKTAARVTADLIRWLDRKPAGPFFAFVNFFDAHELEEPLEPAYDRFGRGARARYDGFIARIDDAIGKLVDQMEQRGLLENTVIIVTSDHGELFGEHGIKSHGNGLHLPALAVPLILIHPRGIPSGTTVAAPVSLQDLGASLVDLAGVNARGAIPGTPFSDYWKPDGPEKPGAPVFSEVEKYKDPDNPGPAAKGPMRSLIDANWHYILNPGGIEELFAWPRDPDELENLAAPGRQPPPDLARLAALARSIPSGYR